MIEFKNVSKVYGNQVAVENINLTINSGEFVCFIGTKKKRIRKNNLHEND